MLSLLSHCSGYAVRKSDLDMVRLVENMSNPVSQCIPQCMYVWLQAGAEFAVISADLSVAFYKNLYASDWVS